MQWLIDLMTEWAAAQGYLTTSFVDRGDPAGLDFEAADLTKDNTWYDLDLAAIVPAAAKAVLLTTTLVDTSIDGRIQFRRFGNINTVNKCSVTIQVAAHIISNDLVCPIGTDQKLQYRVTAGVWPAIQITVKGWWL